MSKLYFLVPDVELTETIVAELKTAQVPEDDIGVIASDQVDLAKLPEADVADRSDIKPALKQGAAIGGATGLLGGLIAVVVPGGFAIGGAALAGMVLAGGAFGAWVSGLIGASVPNREIREFERAIRAGSLLMIVDTTSADREQLKHIITDRHPSVSFGGEEGVVPPSV